MKQRWVLLPALVLSLSFVLPAPARAEGGGTDIARRVMQEGFVLLKNEQQTLPLQTNAAVALFGEGQAMLYDRTVSLLTRQRGYIPFGAGSSMATGKNKAIAPLDALRQAEKDGDVRIYEPLSQAYERDADYVPDDAMLNDAAAFADTAIVFISRWGGECVDFPLTDWSLSEQEKSLLTQVRARFARVAVLLNTGSAIDTAWADDDATRADALAFIGYGGMQGGLGVADCLTGKANPSGKLVTTYACAWEDYPTSEAFTDKNVQRYTEDIYLGYRWFETFHPELVRYPFGFGLSYTSFAWRTTSFTQDGDTVRVTVQVENTGDRAGREVIQLYVRAPQGRLGKPARVLCAFEKTGLLEAGARQEIVLTFSLSDLASYDDTGKTGKKSAYVLEEGTYTFFVGNSVRAEDVAGEMAIDELTVTKQLTEQCATNLDKRLLADGSYETLSGKKVTYTKPTEERVQTTPAQVIRLADVTAGKATLSAFVSQMSESELATFFVAYKGAKSGEAGGDDDVCERYGIHRFCMMDGPSGLGGAGTSFPCSTVLASTWNTRLASAEGMIIGAEAYQTNVDLWLAPGLNLHRNPLSGRCFEYYSEDPLIAGAFGAAIVRSMQSMGCGACIKHFVCNEIEKNKLASDSRVSERALRELYLRPFETVIRQAAPLAIMSSYNVLNGTPVSENASLLHTILREEWGFEGAVTGDWHNNKDIVREINGGNGIRQSAVDCNIDTVLRAIDKGKISRSTLEDGAEAILYTLMRLPSFYRTNTTCGGKHQFGEDNRCKVCHTVKASAVLLAENTASAQLDDAVAFMPEEKEETSGNSHVLPYILGGAAGAAVIGAGAAVIVRKKKKKQEQEQ